MEESSLPQCILQRGKGDDQVIPAVHVDDISIGGEKEKRDVVNESLNKTTPINNLREIKWYKGCAAERY